MKRKIDVNVAVAIATTVLTSSALAEAPVSLRYANQGDLKSLDPYTINETTANAHLGHVYEGLTRRGADLKIQPGLAERWETSSDGLTWRFHLRKGIKFHNGNEFTADDVIFSAARARAPGSNFQARIPADAEFIKVDDHTLDVKLKAPNPIMHYQWDTWYILDKEWAEANNAISPTAASASAPGYASLNTNGTGPFTIASHQPGVKTVFKKHPGWWDKAQHNLDEIVFTPISSDATRVAALLSGEVDVIEPVPLQDIDRVNASPNARVLTGPEVRTIYLGFDQLRDELLHSNIKGKNPFKDRRVREAFYRAIDIDLINKRIMRGMSTPSALLIAPEFFALSKEFERPKFDPELSKKLLAEAGYPKGFQVELGCPNDRYVNDEAICQAVTAMLSRVGLDIKLNAEPKAKFFARALKAGGFQTSFYLLGWTPPTSDGHNVLYDVLGCRTDPNSNRGEQNVGGSCNKEIDALADQILVETDTVKRDQLLKKAFQLAIDDFSYIPLHQQALAWGVSKKFDLPQRADNQVLFHWAIKK